MTGRPSPTVGRIVHYYGGELPDVQSPPIKGPLAALITAADAGDSIVRLSVFTPSGPDWKFIAKYDDTNPPKGGTWRWPPRV